MFRKIRRKFLGSTIFLILLLMSLNTSPSRALQYELGVEVGDWVEYDWTNNSKAHKPYIRIEVLSVTGPPRTSLNMYRQIYEAKISGELYIRNQTQKADFPIVTEVDNWVIGMVIPANSKVGDMIITGHAVVQNHNGTAFMKGETMREYAGARRAVLHTSFSVLGDDFERYYDKQTGVLLEENRFSVWFVEPITTKAVETNMWEGSDSGILVSLDLAHILVLAAGILLVIAIVLMLNRRRK